MRVLMFVNWSFLVGALVCLPLGLFGDEPRGRGDTFVETSSESVVTSDLGETEALFNLSLDELLALDVGSASYLPTTLREVPAYTRIFRMSEIERSPARNLSEILHMFMPGHYTGMHPRYGTLHGVRGILIDNNAKTSVSLDGQRVNERIHFGYNVGMMSPLMGDIDRIEVSSGPGSLVQGSGAINGVINMVPKNGEDHEGSFFNVEHGFREFSTVVEAGSGFSYGPDKNIFIYAGAYGADGFEPDETYGEPPGAGDINAYGFGDTGYRFSAYWNHENFSLNAFYAENNPQSGNDDGGASTRREGWFHHAKGGIRPQLEVELSDEQQLTLRGDLLATDHAFVYRDSATLTGGGSELYTGLSTVYENTMLDNNAFAVALSYGVRRFREKDQFLDRILLISARH